MAAQNCPMLIGEWGFDSSWENADQSYVDVLTMEMVRAPEQFDVIVTDNLFGDIVTDLGAQLQGGIGLAASGNILAAVAVIRREMVVLPPGADVERELPRDALTS